MKRNWREARMDSDLRPLPHADLLSQSDVDNWKEFYFYQYRYYRVKKSKVSKAHRQTKCLPSINDAAARWIEIAETDMKKCEDWLSWIRDQLPEISHEPTSLPLTLQSRREDSVQNTPRPTCRRSSRLALAASSMSRHSHARISKAKRGPALREKRRTIKGTRSGK